VAVAFAISGLSLQPPVPSDLDDYRRDAELFSEEIDREYYRHLAGHKPDLELEPIYERHAALFTREAVERIGEARRAVAGDHERRLRYLHHFALDGHLGARTRELESRLAELEATLELDVEAETMPYRMAPVIQANEPDAERRAEIEAARNALRVERLNPLHLEVLEIVHAACEELGWPSYLDAYSDVRDLDLRGLAERLGEFAEETEAAYAATIDPELELTVGVGLGELRRSDLVRFFRAAHLDYLFPSERMVGALRETLLGLGIDLDAQSNVILDTEPRPTKSPRAFCSTPRIPDEVYLVIPPIGGREDYATLFHEAGHAEHYGCTDATLDFEFRHLGDNAVTESFAFLLEGLTASTRWQEAVLGDTASAAVEHARAARLVMLRRYSAKIAYEVELHGPGTDLGSMPRRYAELLGGRIGVEWPEATWISDVDAGFYVACYLRAWALEVEWRAELGERFGAKWFAGREAGEWLRGIWAQGQRLDAEALLGETTGRSLDFLRLASELTAAVSFRRKFREYEQEVQVEASEGGGVRDQVQKAIDDLRAAGEKATGDVRSGIDSAVSRLRSVSGEASSKAQDQVSGWRDTLDKATDDVRKELGKLAVRAQNSVEALDEIAKELDERRKSLK
jgi:hypothetical protein